MTDNDQLFRPPAATDDMRRRATEKGWPSNLLDRMLALRFPSWKIEQGLEAEGWPTVDMYVAEVADREALANGTLTMRAATWEDDERLADLFACSSERLGDWDVIVERSPNPFAQQRLQENAHVKVLEDRGVAMAVSVQAGRSSIVAGQPVSVGWMGGWRVRNGFRRQGYSSMLLNTPGASASVFGMVSYWYVRLENGTASSWIEHELETVEGARRIEKLSATVQYLPARASTEPDARVRPVAHADLERCVELVNRTHHGLDLFRPYSVDFLRGRLDDLFWGPKPPFVPCVYGWADMAVLIDGGEIVACGGLWDRGRDVRDRRRNRTTGEECTESSTCLLDFGFADGREDAAAALIRHFQAVTHSLERTNLSVALEFLPAVVRELPPTDVASETRHLETMVFQTPDQPLDVTITRPYTDLSYW